MPKTDQRNSNPTDRELQDGPAPSPNSPTLDPNRLPTHFPALQPNAPNLPQPNLLTDNTNPLTKIVQWILPWSPSKLLLRFSSLILPTQSVGNLRYTIVSWSTAAQSNPSTFTIQKLFLEAAMAMAQPRLSRSPLPTRNMTAPIENFTNDSLYRHAWKKAGHVNYSQFQRALVISSVQG